MKNLHVKNLVISASILLLSGICSLGYSQKKSEAAPVKGGVKLEYNYPEGKSFKYLSGHQNSSEYGCQWTINAG